ncbi:MAG: HIT family protein [Methanoregula sp.]|nr:HIT family protein [Methanoregula sp.]
MVPETCPFCNPPAGEIVAKNELCYALWDCHPVSRGHLLVIPFRHTLDFFSITPEEGQALLALIGECKGIIDEKYSPDAYNIGFNAGVAAGQTVMHCHCHVIPRYTGDVPNPRGGVRGVLPKKKPMGQCGAGHT